MDNNLKVLQLKALDQAVLQDLSDLLVCVVEDGASIGFLPPITIVEAAGYWQGAIEPGVLLWVAMKDGVILGTIQLHLAMKANGSHRAEIAKLMVHPNYRRHGAARMLMQTAENAARELGRSLLVLDTRSGDPSNLLYQSLDYIVAGSIPKFARSATGKLDATTIYYKEL
jgi:ribosomal protein S18 acetylase RimI-like enzyme